MTEHRDGPRDLEEEVDRLEERVLGERVDPNREHGESGAPEQDREPDESSGPADGPTSEPAD
jgi:hypothetical protein